MGNFIVVDKAKNDEWMENECKGCEYEKRPWTKSFESLEKAIEYSDSLDYEVEIEDEDSGEVWSKEDDEWVVCFS